MDILFYVLILIVVFGVGFFIGRITTNIDGYFIVNDSDYEKTRWIIDVKADPKTIPNKKEIRLKVMKMEEEDV